MLSLPSLKLIKQCFIAPTSCFDASSSCPDGGRLVYRGGRDLLKVYHLPSLELRREIKLRGTATSCVVSRFVNSVSHLHLIGTQAHNVM